MDNEEIKEAASQVREKIEDVKERVSDVAHRGGEKAKELYGSVREKIAGQDWEHLKESTKNYIKNNPEKAVTAALIAGFVVGFLLRRKSD